jgi:hypothetical protein
MHKGIDEARRVLVWLPRLEILRVAMAEISLRASGVNNMYAVSTTRVAGTSECIAGWHL